jgi:AcrR family transcriptional regulator
MEDIRTKISDAAQDLFLRDGIDGVSMRKVAEKVGVTAPAIYRYFRDKDELLNEIIRCGLEMLEDYLKPALEADDPYQRLHLLIDRYLDFAIEQPKYFDFAFLVPGRNLSDIPEEIQRHNWTTFGMAVEQVAMCMEEGIFRREDPLETSILLWATVHGLVILFRTERFGPGPEQFRQTYRKVVDRLLDALKPGGVTHQPGRQT